MIDLTICASCALTVVKTGVKQIGVRQDQAIVAPAQPDMRQSGILTSCNLTIRASR